MTAASWKASRTRRRRSPATSGWAASIAFYDDNHITIDGPTELAYDDDAIKRFEAYGWRVHYLGEIANDVDALEAAIREALEYPADTPDSKPNLLVLRSHIGWPSPHLTDTGEGARRPLRRRRDPADQGAPRACRRTRRSGFPTRCASSTARRSPAARPTARRMGGALRRVGRRPCRLGRRPGRRTGSPAGPTPSRTSKSGTQLATRHALNQFLDATAAGIPGPAGGLGRPDRQQRRAGEGRRRSRPRRPGRDPGPLRHPRARHGLGHERHGGRTEACCRWAAPSSCFSDYMRPAVRLAALSQAHVIYSWTHDSIGLGQDGPTHQPIEHLASLRAMPGLSLIRPADANETAQAWQPGRRGRRPGRPRASPARTSRCWPRRRSGRPRASPAGAYVLVRPRRRRRHRPGRHRQRGPALRGRGRHARRRRGARPGWSPSPAGTGSSSSPATTAPSVFPPGVPVLSIEAGVDLRLGALRRRLPSASTTSARRRPVASSWRNSASPRTTSSSGPRPCWSMSAHS